MGVLNNLFGPLRRSRSGSFRDGSSRRGRRFGSGKSGHDEASASGKGGDSSAHSGLFDLELSSRGHGRGAADLLARLNSTVHDEGSVKGGGGSTDPSVRLPSGLLQRVIYLGRPVMEFELDLLQDMRALRTTCQLAPDGQLDLPSLVTQLQDLGYACYLKHNNPADPGHRHNVQPSCLEKLRHEYIMCAGRADGSLSHWCMVDPRFREQFAIAQPTPAYDRLLKAVPLEFVGTQLRLQALVETLCVEMAEAFASQQRTLPPWRKFKSMLSKWFDPEEMPTQQHMPAQQQQMPHQLQLHAAAGPPLSPFAPVAHAGAAAPAPAVGPAGLQLRDAQPPVGTPLQQQAAAALAQRTGSGGGSQDFYEALEMHKQSMRLQQAAQQQQRQRGSPPQRGSPETAVAAAQVLLHQQQQQQRQEQQQQRQQQQQQQQPAALSSENLRQLEAAYGVGSAAAAAAAAGAAAGSTTRAGEGSNKPRRRRPPPAGLSLATGNHHQQMQAAASLWDDEDDDGLAGMGGALEALGANRTQMQMQMQLYASGSWSELSTIQEARSNASSTAPATLLAASTAALGTSCASRRSAGSAAMSAALGQQQLPAGSLAGHPRRSPGRLDQMYPPSAAGSAGEGARHGAAAATTAGQPSPPTSLIGFPAQPLARSSLAKTSAAPSSTAQQASSLASSGGSSPVAPLAGRPADLAQQAQQAGPSARGGKKVVSLLAKGLKSVGQKQTWANLLPTVSTVRRVGPNGPLAPQRTWSWRSEDGSSKRGRKAAAEAAAAAAAPHASAHPPLYPRH